MKKSILFLALAVIFFVPLAAFAGPSADIIIDHFDAPALSHTFTSTGETYAATSTLLEVIGGSRAISYTQLVSSGGGDSLELRQNPAAFVSSNGPDGVSAFDILYNANGAGLNVDLSRGENIEAIWNPDHLGFMKPNFMSFTLTDAANHSYESRITWNTYWANQGPDILYTGTIDLWNGGTYTYSYMAPGPGADLTTNFILSDFSSHGVDLKHIKSILFKYESDNSNDLHIESFKVKNGLCGSDLDVVMVMDRSGSMGYASECDWWQLKCVNPPSCSSGYNWVKNIAYNQTQAWCNAKNQPAPHNSVWIEYSPVKITAAKAAANSFMDLMGAGDQSALVSFANAAILDKTLSNNHSQTQTAVNSLIPLGATDIGDAIKLANQELISARHNPSAAKVEILLTDGMANKPSGPGYGEHAPDVAYAQAQAVEAAAAGIKIFTIGLGGEINSAMLEQIALTTGGKYYFAPTAADLDDIFALLQPGVCEQEPVCGNGLKEAGEQCDGTDGVGANQSCSDTCTLINLPYCGDGIKNGTEECDGTDGVGEHQSCSQSCTLTNLSYCGDGIKNGTEACDDGNQIDTDECKNDCSLPACQSGVDVMMVLDRSGSMGYTSRCDWYQLKCVNPPSCSSGYNWVKNTTYNQTQAWCNAKNQPAPHNSVWTEYSPVKITAAKAAANNFIDKLRASDQSGLVSYANSATLDKQLSGDHSATKTAVSGLITNGATDIGDAIKLAAGELLSARAKPQADKVMILLTDGMANKPYGSGSGENPTDVAYAQAKAVEAAAAGIKIFTIGLGDEIDAAMLQNIASVTGGEYYFAPTAGQLQAIFDQITLETCGQIVYGDNPTESYGQPFRKNEQYAKLEPLLISC